MAPQPRQFDEMTPERYERVLRKTAAFAKELADELDVTPDPVVNTILAEADGAIAAAVADAAD
jgi:prolyl-tRNA editing enzyme YbaK/EbsC (Cys-tRNA(Pro) deacylase)